MSKCVMDQLEERILERLSNEECAGEDLGDLCALLDRYTIMEKNFMDYEDKENRTAVEKEKIAASIEVESKKNEMTKPRMALEIAKIIVPTVLPMIAYGIFQRRVLEFEETGRINSTAGRELHLPRFMK